MSAREFRAGRRCARVVSSAGALIGVMTVLGVGPVGCAGKHHINEEPPHPIAIEVENNLTIPTEMTVYITQDQGGMQQMLGTVPGAQTRTFTYKPYAWSQTYRLIGRRQLAGPVRSPAFTLADPEVGTVSWIVVPNQVQFYGLPDTTTTPPAPAPAPTH